MEKATDYKVIVINPEDEEYGLEAGKINYLGKITSNYYHYDVLMEYGETIYGENSFYAHNKTKDYLVQAPVLFLNKSNNIVLLHIPGKRRQENVLLYLPDELCPEQLKSLTTVIEQLKNCNFEINCNLRVENGFLESDTEDIDKFISILLERCHNKSKKEKGR